MPHSYSAERYARRGIFNTDYLAFRCIEELDLLSGLNILDLGCGAGRSSRFLRDLGNVVTGIDQNRSMITAALESDPDGDYRHVPRGDTLPFANDSFGALFSSWMILEEGSNDEIIRLFTDCHRVLKPGSLALVVTNTPEFYQYHWVSCRVDHPENQPPLRSGQPVRATLLPEEVVVDDYFWSEQDYTHFFTTAGFEVVDSHRPIGKDDDPFEWIDEKQFPPYVIYQLRKKVG